MTIFHDDLNTDGHAAIDGHAVTDPHAVQRLLRLIDAHGCPHCRVLPSTQPHICEHGVTAPARPGASASPLATIPTELVTPDDHERATHILAGLHRPKRRTRRRG